MYIEATRRINDADILAHSISKQSDSEAILRILGFEALLKCALEIRGIAPPKSHDYVKLFSTLPYEERQEIISVATSRMPGLVDLSNPEKLLTWYRLIFEKESYYYEFYEGYTLEEKIELGEFWIEIGAPTEEAEVQYFPNELFCLIEGLKSYTRCRLSVS